MFIENTENEYISYLLDLLKPVGPVNVRKLFGGYGIFLEGLMFALVADCTLYLKVDQESEQDFKEQGMQKFVYSKKGKQYSMSYYQAPDEVFEEVGAMTIWGQKAYAAAFRVAKKAKK